MSAYFLADDAKVFWDSDQTFRLRKGVWNYTEAVLSIQKETDTVKGFYKRCAEALILAQSCDIDTLMTESGVEGEMAETIRMNFTQLSQQGFLHRSDQNFLTQSLTNLLSFSFSELERISYIQPALFLSEDGCSAKIAEFLSKEMKYPLDMADIAFMRELAAADLTTKSEAMEHLKSLERFEKSLKPYSAILGCFIRPPVLLLRNLNRVLVKLKTPLILGFVDGPFLTILSTASPETGCFECFEHRVLARLEDTAAYTSFVKKATEIGRGRKGDGRAYSPLVGLIVSVVLSEGFLAGSVRINKTSGRIINIYLPTLEIQVQDLLRVPYCPACGSVAAAEMDELYTSGRALIDTMLEKIEVVKAN